MPAEESLGHFDVKSGTVLLFDFGVIDAFSERGSARAAVVWGLHGEEVAKRLEAARIGERIHALRETGELRFAYDFRPHTDAFLLLGKIRRSPTESGTIEVGGHAVCGFMTSVGDGFFPVSVEVDTEGRPPRCVISIASEDDEENDDAGDNAVDAGVSPS